jgi:hypothetical protein
MEVDRSLDLLVSADIRDGFVARWCRGVKIRSRECAEEHGISGARLKGEESDLLSLAVERFVLVHSGVVGVSWLCLGYVVVSEEVEWVMEVRRSSVGYSALFNLVDVLSLVGPLSLASPRVYRRSSAVRFKNNCEMG